MTIPVNEPALGDRDRAYVEEALRTGWISSAGEFLTRFEREWAAYCGRAHGVAVANGSVALQIAVAALELEPGDEVIMPTFTIVSCATAAVYNDVTPVLVDSDAETWCLDVAAVEARIGPRTRAIMPVHIYGHPVEMAPLLELAERHGLAIVEDAAEAHGAECRVAGEWRRCGSFGEASCFSFYANKLVTTGEGGMVVTDDAALAERLRALRNLGFGVGRHRFLHEQLGHNFRLTNLQAALGVGQIERMDEIVARKRAIAAAYTEALSGLPLQLPAEREWARSVYWMYALVLDDDAGLDAEQLAAALSERGVETRPFFLGLHEQPALHARGLFCGERHPVAERIARRGLYLPSGLALTDEQVAEVSGAVRAVLA